MQQFKVGNWVRMKLLEGNLDVKPVQIQAFDSVDFIINGYKAASSDLVHWQPRQGEWCWFWNEYSKYTLTLGKLARYSEEEKLYFSYNGVVYMSYEHCEPFVGELPSLLKEQ